MRYPMKKSKSRHAIRLRAGKLYYTLKRYVYWRFGGVVFARRYGEQLAYEHVSHRTPLLRKLRNVDMYMQYNKITNLKIAVPRVNGITVYPGETFSYWKQIGKPTKRKGYRQGMVLQNGLFRPGTGGGLCQLSNLIYWMTLHTPLTIVERHRHGYDVFPDADRTQPFGSGATCFYNYGDLMIRNDTLRPFQLVLKVTRDELTGAWMSDAPPDYRYEVYEKDHLIQSEYWGGYTRHNNIYRKKYDVGGALVDDEFVVENHAVMMYAPLLSEVRRQDKNVK